MTPVAFVRPVPPAPPRVGGEHERAGRDHDGAAGVVGGGVEAREHVDRGTGAKAQRVAHLDADRAHAFGHDPVETGATAWCEVAARDERAPQHGYRHHASSRRVAIGDDTGGELRTVHAAYREVVTLQHRPGREVTGCHERVLLGPEPRGAPVQRGEVGRDDGSGDDGDDERAGPERQGTR